MRRFWVLPFVAVLAAAVVVARPPAFGHSGGPQRVQLAESSVGSVDVRPGIVYSPSGQRLDLYRPATAAAGPTGAVVFVHGGGWRSGDRSWYRAQGVKAARRGWVAASIDYRLAPAHPFPAALADVRAAVAWMRDHASELGIDRDRIALVGGSAGGNLALLAGVHGAPVRGVVAWSPPTDLTTLRGRTLDPLVRDYFGCTCPARVRAASPIANVTASSPPLLVANSTDEMIPLTQATAFAARARDLGVDVELDVMPGTAHSTQYGDRIWPATVRFLERTIGSPASA